MGTGGLRIGAGRPGWRRKCENCLGLDIRNLVRDGCIPSESEQHITRYGSRYWTCNKKLCGYVRYQAEHNRLRLTYVVNGNLHDYWISLERTPCRYGGSRPWFQCPTCGDRRAVLYGMATVGRFGCRRCMRLAYYSETESRVDRINRRAHRLEAKLDDGRKPKWMRWRTFRLIWAQLDELDQAWGAEALVRFGIRFM